MKQTSCLLVIPFFFLCLAGCSDNSKSVAWYKNNREAAEEMVKKCNQIEYERDVPVDCDNALEAMQYFEDDDMNKFRGGENRINCNGNRDRSFWQA